MAIQFVDPRAKTSTPVDPYDLSVDLHDEAAVIGLFANGFPDSVAFLDQVEAALAVSLPNAAFRRYNKGGASSIASDEMIDTITSECNAVVAAYGH